MLTGHTGNVLRSGVGLGKAAGGRDKIVRFKNKFHPSSTDTFKNIMVNALVRGGAGAARGNFGTRG